MTYPIYVVCPPGLEPFLRQEISDLGLKFEAPPALSGKEEAGEDAGGIELVGPLDDLCRLNLHLRTASRVIVRMGTFHASKETMLRQGTARLCWEQFLQRGQAIAVRVTCHRSRLYHTRAVTEWIVNGIADRLKAASPVVKFDENAPGPLPQLILARLVEDECTISVDTSGEHLHRRGYRLATAKAPLRENLAAGILLASGWDLNTPLLDPFCGSGTLPIEAALMARRILPGKQRHFALMDWPTFRLEHWRKILAEAQKFERSAPAPIWGSDRDAGAIQISAANAARAGVADSIEFTCQAISSITSQGAGCLVANPPYGLRISSSKDLRNLYARFGDVLRLRCPGWRFAILCSDEVLLRQTGLDYTAVISLLTGGVRVRLAVGVV